MSENGSFAQDSDITQSEHYPWVRYVDEQGLPYWYNHDTHESQWDEEALSGQGGDIELVRTSVPDRKSSNPESKKSGKRESKKTKRKRNYSNVGYFELELSSMVYYSFLWFNVFVCEMPIVLLEGVMRLTLLAIGLSCVAVYYFILSRGPGSHNSTHISQLKDYLATIGRDMLLTAAGLLTLLIPGSLYLVYRNMTPHVAHTDPDGEVAHWTLNSIPSVLGPVDPRRFGVITIFGAGANASNALAGESGGGESKEGDLRGADLDGWPNSCVYLPRNVLYRMQDSE
eukprot:gene38598-46923_t